MTATERKSVLKRLMKDRTSEIDELTNRLLLKLAATEPTSDEYPKLLTHLERVTKLKDRKASRKVSPDTWVTVGGNVLIVVAVLGYERGHVVVTRALNFVTKTKS